MISEKKISVPSALSVDKKETHSSNVLHPYPSYQDSGVPWLGKIPSGWKLVKTKYLFDERVQKGYPDESLLAATQTKGVVPKAHYETRTVTAQKDLHLLKLVEVGDFVISLRSFQGGIEYAYHRGIISPAYTIMVPRDKIEATFFRQLAKSSRFIELLRLCVTGIREGQNIDYGLLRESRLPVPAHNEQKQIARYLDWKTAQIGKFIRNKRQLIALLKEQKQNLIHHAVTRGLDPDAPTKPSGIEWLGDIPEHWEVIRLGRVIYLLTGFPFKSEDFSKDSEGIKLLRGVNVSTSGVRWEQTVKWARSPNDGLELFELKEGDIVLGMDRPIIASGVRVAVVTRDDLPCLLLQRVARIRPHKEIMEGYLLRLVQGQLFECYIAPIFTGISVPHLSANQIRDFRIPLPPLDEQQAILTHIEKQTATIDAAVARAEREIELIGEYRTRLIADVVTGQVDVRHIEVPEGDWSTENAESTEADAEIIDEKPELEEVEL